MAPIKHGANLTGKRTKLYGVWLTMRNKCSNPNHDRYKYYGARGIKVCERWNDFSAFREDMGNPPDDGRCTIDRIDVNGDYEPGNVRWATWETQQNNKRSNRILTLPDGRQMTLKQASRELKVDWVALRNKLRKCNDVVTEQIIRSIS